MKKTSKTSSSPHWYSYINRIESQGLAKDCIGQLFNQPCC